MSHIFVSYSRADVEFSRYLRMLLENDGFHVWMDEKRLAPGSDWWGEIEQNIDTCGAFVVVMSPESWGSVFVRNEILRALDQKRPIFPVWLSGEPFGLLAHVQYEDCRAGLNATLSRDFLGGLANVLPRDPDQLVTFSVMQGDALRYEADVMGLKYAQTFHGLGRKVSNLLVAHGMEVGEMIPTDLGDYRLVEASDNIAAQKILYVGVPPIVGGTFKYGEIREFARQTLTILGEAAPDTQHLLMTVHGPNFGLDEVEAVLAQFGGYIDALNAGTAPPNLSRITILERKAQRAQNMQTAMAAFLDEASYTANVGDSDNWNYQLRIPRVHHDATSIAEPERKSDEKPFALVIMPDSEDFDDIFYYGVQRPVHVNGLLCERISLSAELLDEDPTAILNRIDDASVIIVDTTNLTPELYTHLGYAWGSKRPTIVLSKGTPHKTLLVYGSHVEFDKIWELEERLIHRIEALTTN